MSRGKVAILNHGYMPHYRVRFYELLAERGGIEYVVFHGAPPSWVGTAELKGPFAFPQRRVDNHEFRVGPLSLIYQPVVWEILTGGYAAIVITTESKFISNLVLALLCKLRGIAVLYWGFGYHPPRGSRESDVPNPTMLAITTAIKKGFTKLADGFIAYTKSGAEQLIAGGYPRERTFFVQNTIDMSEQLRLYESERDTDTQEIRREFGDTLGEARTAIALGEAHKSINGPGEAALANVRRAVDLLRPLGVSSILGVAINNLGDLYYELGDLDSAAKCFAESRDMGGQAEGYALDNLGRVYRDLRRPDDAIASFGESVLKHRASGQLRAEARALKHLGEVRHQIGHTAAAREALTRAVEIFEQVADQPEAKETALLLASLGED